MEFFILLVFILTCYGISNEVIYSDGPFNIFIKWRNFTNRINDNFGKLFSCMMCFPFWVGAIISAVDLFLFGGVVFTPYNIIFQSQPNNIYKIIAVLFLDGSLSSGTTWIIHNIEEYFESNKS